MSLIILSTAYCSTRLKQHLLPNGRLYFIGMNPIPYEPNNPPGNIISNIRRARDACILLAGHRPLPVSYLKHIIVADCDGLLH